MDDLEAVQRLHAAYQRLRDELSKVLPKDTLVFTISAAAHKGLTEVLRALQAKVSEVRAVQALETPEEDDETTVITLGEDQLSNHWEVIFDQELQIYQVSGEKIEKFARRTNYDNYETLNRLRDIMRKLGIYHELTRQGATGQSIIQIGDSTPFTFVEQ